MKIKIEVLIIMLLLLSSVSKQMHGQAARKIAQTVVKGFVAQGVRKAVNNAERPAVKLPVPGERDSTGMMRGIKLPPRDSIHLTNDNDQTVENRTLNNK